MSKLFEGLNIKGLDIKNRIMMPPMCMFCAGKDGLPNDWHFVHYATRAVGGTGLIIVEATAVESCGRITDSDLGIWSDEHIAGLNKIAEAIKSNGAVPGIQLAHAGRKSEVTYEPVIAPSAIAFSNEYKTPEEMSAEGIKRVIGAFKNAAGRALKAGFEIIELHAAHGYLINQFLSPLTNKRKDQYGGSLENRARFLKEVLEAVSEVWTEDKPLMIRVSAEDYDESGNHPEDLAEIINLVKGTSVDIVDVSSGGVIAAGVKSYPGYQVGFAETIKRTTGIPVVAGGLITDAAQAEEIISSCKADMVFLGRELLREPYWPLKAAHELNVGVQWPRQYEGARFR